MSDETKHGREPWHADDYRSDVGGRVRAIVDADGLEVLGDTGLLSRVDRARIIAAVNAVAGIPTEALEAGALAKALDLLAKMAAKPCEGGGWVSGHSVPAAEAAHHALVALGRLP